MDAKATRRQRERDTALSTSSLHRLSGLDLELFVAAAVIGIWTIWISDIFPFLID
jgi:hypothetical protein